MTNSFQNISGTTSVCMREMSAILRLEGLDVKAGPEDIRSFFKSLHIPDGGVYILGGSLKEAFIAFSTERDAKHAMRQNGNVLKGSTVTLHTSSMAELEQRLESLLNKTSKLNVLEPQPDLHENLTSSPCEGNTTNLSPSILLDQDTPKMTSIKDHHALPQTLNVPDLDAQVLDSKTAFLLGVCTVLQGLQSANIATPGVDLNKAGSTAVSSEELITQEQTFNSQQGYVRLFGLPASTTKEDICHFFKGLTVQEAIVNVKLGVHRGCLVKFAKMQDALDALHFNGQSLGSVCVEVRGADAKMWTGALQECESALDVGVLQKPVQHFVKEGSNERESVSQLKRQTPDRLQCIQSKRQKPDTASRTSLSPLKEYIVMVTNLPRNVTKTELKELFGCPDIPHKNVLHLLDGKGDRTDTAFLIFNRTEDFDYAMNLSGCHLGSGAIEVSSITREIMKEMIIKNRPKNSGLRDPRTKRRSNSRYVEPVALPRTESGQTTQTCVFVRNMPANVKKSHIKNLFWKFEVKSNDVFVLHDNDGSGTGEAVVKFQTEELAAQAQMMHGKKFLGSKVLLTLISVKQMEDILRI